MNPSDHEKSLYEKLAADARLFGEARMLRDENPFTEDARISIIERFSAYLKNQGKTFDWASRQLGGAGFSASVLSELIAGKYQGDTEKKCRAIDRWLEKRLLRDRAPKPAGFVRIKVAQMIEGLARWVCANGKIGFIYGPAGIGKTIALQAVCSDYPASAFISITRAGHSARAIVSTLCSAMQISSRSYVAWKQQDDLVEAIRGTNRLIIVDEIHKLEGRRRDEALHTLREIHMESGCPMIWAGMASMAMYIQQQRTKHEDLDQVYSRIGMWLDLKSAAEQSDGGDGLFSVDDLRKFLGSHKLKFQPDAEAWLKAQANLVQGGYLRTIDNIMSALKVKYSLDEGATVTLDMVRRTRIEQLGGSLFNTLERQITARMTAAG